MKFTIELGAEVKSDIHGFKGIVVSRADNINGCNRYYIQPETEKKTGKFQEGCWLDESELVVVKKATLRKKNPDRGGPPSRIK